MKTTFFLLLIFSFTSHLSGQGFATSFSVHGGVGIGYRSVQFTQPVSRSVIESRELFEHAGSSWEVGVSGSKQVGRRFWIRTGIRLVTTGYRIDGENTIGVGDSLVGSLNSYFGLQNIRLFVRALDDRGLVFSDRISQGFVDPDASTENINDGFYINFRHLEIPLLLRYEVNEKRLKPFAEIGLAADFLVSSQFYTVRDDRRNFAIDRMLEGSGRTGITLLFSAGAAYEITSNIDVFMHPVIRYSLTPLRFGDAGVTEKPRSLMVEVGVRKTIYR